MRTPAALFAAALLVAGCSIGDADGPDVAQPAATETVKVPPGSPAVGEDTAAGAVDVPTLVSEIEPSIVAIIRDRGEGSGVIVDSGGTIVTNNHVVEGAASLEVQFADGQRVPATVEAADPLTDLAIVRVERTGLPAVTFADDLPQVGEFALALGNPLGFQNTATVGIVSGLHRSLPAVPGGPGSPAALVDLIQTDAAISPGSSGGALIGADGEVLGVNIAYAPPQTGAVALGFAIPSTTVVDIVDELLDDGRVEHAFLGIQPAPISPQVAQRFDLPADEGVLIVGVESGTPAERAGLDSGMVITAFDGEPVRRVTDLYAALRDRDPGDEVTLTVVQQDGAETEVSVTLGERPTQS